MAKKTLVIRCFQLVPELMQYLASQMIKHIETLSKYKSLCWIGFDDHTKMLAKVTWSNPVYHSYSYLNKLGPGTR